MPFRVLPLSEAVQRVSEIPKKTPVIALAGNPNVGKSSVFNLLTGLHQHTGNWSGKTVVNTIGTCTIRNESYLVADLPGAYSLSPESAEETAARDFIAFNRPDLILYVCGALSLERNLMMYMQITEFAPQIILCVNMTDEAEAKGEKIDFSALEELLHVPVIPLCAKKKKGVEKLKETIYQCLELSPLPPPPCPRYYPHEEALIKALSDTLPSHPEAMPSRALAIRCLEQDTGFLKEYSDCHPDLFPDMTPLSERAARLLKEHDADAGAFSESISLAIADACERAAQRCIQKGIQKPSRVDRLLTGKLFAFPAMFLLLALIFWITISGANLPSEWLNRLFVHCEGYLLTFFSLIRCPEPVTELLVYGVYRVVTWIISVMLPPMAIFFPLFTLLEDSGYLPRIAFNLDRVFSCCGACGKQALTMCMGFGCNAVGVTGCQIIGSERERLIAILTNSFSPCNGRFPMMIAIIAMFSGVHGSLPQAFILAGMIAFSMLTVFGVSKLLSCTLLKGKPSSFILELPPYRKPQIGSVIVHSLKDRTLFVLLRAVTVAAPCGVLIWFLSNISLGNGTLLNVISGCLDPAAALFGLDGVILFAFILGIPANEIVIPIIMMTYLASGKLAPYESLAQLKELFVLNGWTLKTALCTCTFALMHWPCATTLLTIRRETKSTKWTVLSFWIPTVCGLTVCLILNGILTWCGL